MAILNMFPSGGAIRIKLATIADFYASPQNNSVNLTWSDPADKYTTAGDLAAEWLYTRIIRKEGSQPVGPNDGVLIVESMVRDQYKTTPFVDDNGVENGTTYYYAAYAYNTENVVNDGAFSSAKPVVFRPALSDNTWAEIAEAGSLGRASELWQIGDEKSFTAGDETLTAVILDFDHDTLTSGGKAPITFGIKTPMSQMHAWHSTSMNSVTYYSQAEIRTWLTDTIFPTIEEDLRTVIKNVNKTVSRINESKHAGSATVRDPIWLFGYKEITGSSYPDTRDGTQYPYYATQSNRPSQGFWTTARTMFEWYNGSYYDYYNCGLWIKDRNTANGWTSPNNNQASPSVNRYIVFGFCI